MVRKLRFSERFDSEEELLSFIRTEGHQYGSDSEFLAAAGITHYSFVKLCAKYPDLTRVRGNAWIRSVTRFDSIDELREYVRANAGKFPSREQLYEACGTSDFHYKHIVAQYPDIEELRLESRTRQLTESRFEKHLDLVTYLEEAIANKDTVSSITAATGISIGLLRRLYPSIMTIEREEAVRRLSAVISKPVSVDELLEECNISVAAYYDILKDNPELAAQREEAKLVIKLGGRFDSREEFAEFLEKEGWRYETYKALAEELDIHYTLISNYYSENPDAAARRKAKVLEHIAPQILESVPLHTSVAAICASIGISQQRFRDAAVHCPDIARAWDDRRIVIQTEGRFRTRESYEEFIRDKGGEYRSIHALALATGGGQDAVKKFYKDNPELAAAHAEQRLALRKGAPSYCGRFETREELEAFIEEHGGSFSTDRELAANAGIGTTLLQRIIHGKEGCREKIFEQRRSRPKKPYVKGPKYGRFSSNEEVREFVFANAIGSMSDRELGEQAGVSPEKARDIMREDPDLRERVLTDRRLAKNKVRVKLGDFDSVEELANYLKETDRVFTSRKEVVESLGISFPLFAAVLRSDPGLAAKYHFGPQKYDSPSNTGRFETKAELERFIVNEAPLYANDDDLAKAAGVSLRFVRSLITSRSGLREELTMARRIPGRHTLESASKIVEFVAEKSISFPSDAAVAKELGLPPSVVWDIIKKRPGLRQAIKKARSEARKQRAGRDKNRTR